MENYLELKENIVEGNFNIARRLAKTLSKEEFGNFMMGQPYDVESEVVFYFFLVDWLFEEESAELQELASAVMSFGLNWMPGAYSLGLGHMRRAMELDSDNLNYKQGILIFHDIPDRLLPKQEAIEISKEILSKDPSCAAAQNILQKYDIDF
ncbi:MAG: hypothetical protein FWH31_04950 [Streptococcaceae bacterium]|nr:hypothetical protein [Streptococcaceae bacterium]